MQKKKLEEMNLLDDFLFFKLLGNDVIGEEFGRYLLEIIFDRKFGRLKVTAQKIFYGQDSDKHGIRLDVYMEETIDSETLLNESAIYDIEPESMEKKDKKDTLPRRVRFYHSTIDVNSLAAGADYSSLKKVIVVMIMPFDPFGYDQMVYTIQNTCLEVPELPYDDGAKTMFLYTRGTQGNPSTRLKELLHYMEETKAENVKNEELRAIHNLVRIVKRDPEVAEAYMKWVEIRNNLIEQGIEQGIERGKYLEFGNHVKRLVDIGKTKEEIAFLLDKNISEVEAVLE